MSLFICFLGVSFLVGGFPTAYLAGKIIKGIDIRQFGSGNVGATNAFRVLGKGPGSVVFALDFLKGLAPVFVYQRFPGSMENVFYPVGVGVAAILGHVFSPYLRFKGGKGVATGAGALFFIFPKVFLVSLVCWLCVFFSTKIVSISSIVAALALVIASIAFGYEIKIVGFFLLVAIFVLWTHRSNIKRLMRGEEGTRSK